MNISPIVVVVGPAVLVASIVLVVAAIALVVGWRIGSQLDLIRREVAILRVLHETIARQRGIELTAYGDSFDEIMGNWPSSAAVVRRTIRERRAAE